jgi:DNA-binding IclR family transcriptional regulator
LEDNQKMIILQVLSKALGGAPLGYITKHSGIADVCKLLNELEDEGYVQRCPPNPWSGSLCPAYKITEKGHFLLENFFVRKRMPLNES